MVGVAIIGSPVAEQTLFQLTGFVIAYTNRHPPPAVRPVEIIAKLDDGEVAEYFPVLLRLHLQDASRVAF